MGVIRALKHIIEIERDTTTQSATGHPTKTPQVVATIYAGRMWIGHGNENMESGKQTPQNKCVWTVRGHNNVLETDRIIYDGDRYDIEFIQPIDKPTRGAYLKITTTLSK